MISYDKQLIQRYVVTTYITGLLRDPGQVDIRKGYTSEKFSGGTAPPLKLGCLVLYLKIIDNFFEKQIMHLNSYKKLFKELKNSIANIVAGQAVLKLQIKTVKMLFLDQ